MTFVNILESSPDNLQNQRELHCFNTIAAEKLAGTSKIAYIGSQFALITPDNGMPYLQSLEQVLISPIPDPVHEYVHI